MRAEYGVDLRSEIKTQAMHVIDLADLVAWLPPGCAFWQSFGGPTALSAEARELREVAFWIRVLDYRERGSKGPKPERADLPAFAHERRSEEQAQNRKAAAYLRRKQLA